MFAALFFAKVVSPDVDLPKLGFVFVVVDKYENIRKHIETLETYNEHHSRRVHRRAAAALAHRTGCALTSPATAPVAP